MTERERSATLHSTKSDAELIEYGRDVIRTMKANGYGGIVWDEVLDRFERLKVQSATETLRVRCQPCGRITSDEGRCPDCPDRGTEPPPPQEARAPSATAFTRDAIIEHCAVLAECANPHDGRDHTECPFCCSAADIRTLKNAAPQDDLKGSEALHRPLAGLAASSHRPDATPAVAAPDRNPWPEVIAEPQNTSGPQGDMAGIIEAAERYRWFRDECAWFRRADIVEVAGEDADMLDHHIDKGRCGL